MTNYNMKNKYYVNMCEKVDADFKEWLREHYWDKEMSGGDLAELAYGKRKNTPNITRWMKKLGIPTRSRTDAIALQWKDNHERRENQRKLKIDFWENDTKAREKVIKKMQTKEYKEKQRIAKTGERNGMWNSELTEEERERYKRHARRYPGYKDFRKSVYERDKYTCQVCSDDTGGNLVVHHLNGFHWDVNGRTDINNGVTLCNDCHNEFHRIYGRRDNNFFQFSQFLTSKALTK